MDFYARFYQEAAYLQTEAKLNSLKSWVSMHVFLKQEEAAAYTLIEAKINSWKSWISMHVFIKQRRGSCLYTDWS
jgi:hypothetical protein